jgi:serine protein kinase
MRDPTSGEVRDPDENFMADIERVLMGEGERPQDFRRSVIGTIGARALENPNEKPDFTEIFKHYIARLREDFYSKRKKTLRKIYDSFLRYTSSDLASMDPKEREQAEGMLRSLEQRYRYCENCARDTVAYLLKKRYAE